MDILEKVFNIVLRILWLPFLVIWKFFKDVMRNMYARIVGAVALAVLIYLVHLFTK